MKLSQSSSKRKRKNIYRENVNANTIKQKTTLMGQNEK